MSFFLKLRHWELFLMLMLPSALCWLWRVPFSPLVVASIGLFLMIVPFGIWGLTILYGLYGAARCLGGHDFKYAVIGNWLNSQN